MDVNMDILPSGNIFSELERICTTGYFSSQPSIEDQWQQVNTDFVLISPLVSSFIIINIQSKFVF
ncbi:Krueppel-like factor luna isoform X3 [Lucilia sericata]|uniref:Krueppel-like factor luna isoform X3 n=1 Tax=Lucilia sericata TaxID=13632 RepID=UPI0018A7FF11|nr:Krueppel-like factor luna isoform X3 [Lucilia sericata]